MKQFVSSVGGRMYSGIITRSRYEMRWQRWIFWNYGTTILTEVPEMSGAETILMNRCENRDLFEKTVDMINSYEQYFKDHHQTIYENPSPEKTMY